MNPPNVKHSADRLLAVVLILVVVLIVVLVLAVFVLIVILILILVVLVLVVHDETSDLYINGWAAIVVYPLS